MDELTDFGQFANGDHQLFGDIDRVAGHKPNAADAVDLIEAIEQVGKECGELWLVFAIAVDILSEQGDLFVSSICEALAFSDDIIGMAGDLRASCVGDDAVGAVLVAAAYD